MCIIKIHHIKNTLNLSKITLLREKKLVKLYLYFFKFLYTTNIKFMNIEERIPYIRVLLTGNDMLTFAPIVSVLFSKTRLPPCILIICSATNNPIP